MMPPPLMISAIGAPGSGKTTFSLWLCQALKRRGVAAEFVPEVIKHDVFTPEGVARVRSGRFDARYLRHQHALTKGFLRGPEVIVNDGALEPFMFYAETRMPCDKLRAFADQMARYRKEQSVCPTTFVLVQRDVGYVQAGRYQTPEEALAMSTPIVDCLARHFQVAPEVVRNDVDEQEFLETIVAAVLARRPNATPTPGPEGPRWR